MNNGKGLALSIIIAVILIAGALLYAGSGSRNTGLSAPVDTATTSTVSIENGVQVIGVSARGGYLPRSIIAKAGIPTVLRVTTQNTYDCSVALTIPKIGFKKFLGSNNVTDIPVTVDQATGTLRGLCSMGMYSFQVRFE